MFTPVDSFRNSDTRYYGPAALEGGKPYWFGIDNDKLRARAPEGFDPAKVVAVTGTVTVVQATASGFLTIWPTGSYPPDPLTTAVSYPAGLPATSAFTTGLDGSGFFAQLLTSASVIVDITGFWSRA